MLIFSLQKVEMDDILQALTKTRRVGFDDVSREMALDRVEGVVLSSASTEMEDMAIQSADTLEIRNRSRELQSLILRDIGLFIDSVRSVNKKGTRAYTFQLMFAGMLKVSNKFRNLAFLSSITCENPTSYTTPNTFKFYTRVSSYIERIHDIRGCRFFQDIVAAAILIQEGIRITGRNHAAYLHLYTPLFEKLVLLVAKRLYFRLTEKKQFELRKTPYHEESCQKNKS
jgi:hypothetical protein